MQKLTKEQADLLWKQYEQNINLFKFYMDLLVKFNVFYYAVTGGIVAYVLKNSKVALIEHALLLPVIMSLAFSVFFLYGAKLMKVIREEVFFIRDQIGFSASPDVGILSVLLVVYSVIFLAVASACVFLYCRL